MPSAIFLVGGAPSATTTPPTGRYCGNVNTGAAGKNITYGELTVGATYSPPLTMPSTLGLVIRPEARFDSIIGGSAHVAPYDVGSNGQGKKSSQITLAVDTILSF